MTYRPRYFIVFTLLFLGGFVVADKEYTLRQKLVPGTHELGCLQFLENVELHLNTSTLFKMLGLPQKPEDFPTDLTAISQLAQEATWLKPGERGFLVRYLSGHGVSNEALARIQIEELAAGRAPYYPSWNRVQMQALANVIAQNPALTKQLGEVIETLKSAVPATEDAVSKKTLALAESIIASVNFRREELAAIEKLSDWKILYRNTTGSDSELEALASKRLQKMKPVKEFEDLVQQFAQGNSHEAYDLLEKWDFEKRRALLWYWGARHPDELPDEITKILEAVKGDPSINFDSELDRLDHHLSASSPVKNAIKAARDFRRENGLGIANEKIVRDHPGLLQLPVKDLISLKGAASGGYPLVEQLLSSNVQGYHRLGIEIFHDLSLDEKLLATAKFAIPKNLVDTMVTELIKSDDPEVDTLLRALLAQLQYHGRRQNPPQRDENRIKEILRQRFERGIKIPLESKYDATKRGLDLNPISYDTGKRELFRKAYDVQSVLPFAEEIIKSRDPSERQILSVHLKNFPLQLTLLFARDRSRNVCIDALRNLNSYPQAEIGEILDFLEKKETDPSVKDLIDRMLKKRNYQPNPNGLSDQAKQIINRYLGGLR